ncbi:Uncharacterized protein SGRAN_2370 [Sphingopyxis granuli]|uniref:EpsG family protein n=1 Tax=Sphingopyxis granuli TaxID=267128 RepID=A0AA86GQ87_9SPHN|nr:Uncharacterized protein SGRAN_2370 [Sphingopyxis granuli]
MTIRPPSYQVYTTHYKNFWLASLLVGLISLIPWVDIILDKYNAILWDREVYIQIITSGDSLFSYFNYDDILSYFTFEYTWQSIIYFIQNGQFPFQYESFFQFISTSFLVTSSLIVYRRGGLLALSLMVNPLIFDLAYSQLRTALAICIINIVYLVRPSSKILSSALCIFSVSIHTAMSIFLSIYYLCVSTSEKGGIFSKWSLEMRLLIIVGAGAFVGILIGPFREFVLSSVNDRRAEYIEMSSSPLYLSFWIILFFLFMINYKDIFKKHGGKIFLIYSFSGYGKLVYIVLFGKISCIVISVYIGNYSNL